MASDFLRRANGRKWLIPMLIGFIGLFPWFFSGISPMVANKFRVGPDAGTVAGVSHAGWGEHASRVFFSASCREASLPAAEDTPFSSRPPSPLTSLPRDSGGTPESARGTRALPRIAILYLLRIIDKMRGGM